MRPERAPFDSTVPSDFDLEKQAGKFSVKFAESAGKFTNFHDSVTVTSQYLYKKTLSSSKTTIFANSVFENLYKRSFLAIQEHQHFDQNLSASFQSVKREKMK